MLPIAVHLCIQLGKLNTNRIHCLQGDTLNCL